MNGVAPGKKRRHDPLGGSRRQARGNAVGNSRLYPPGKRFVAGMEHGQKGASDVVENRPVTAALKKKALLEKAAGSGRYSHVGLAGKDSVSLPVGLPVQPVSLPVGR